MTTDLSRYDADKLPNADALRGQRYAIIVADWNSEITYPMAQAAMQTLIDTGVTEDNILLQHVPGTVELTYAAARLVAAWDIIPETEYHYDAIILIGCVIKGETPHFDYVCQSVTQGMTKLNVEGIVPVIFSVLTVNNLQQALDRAGGRLGNKGVEGAITAIRMANLELQ